MGGLHSLMCIIESVCIIFHCVEESKTITIKLVHPVLVFKVIEVFCIHSTLETQQL